MSAVLSKEERLQLIAAQICRYANGGCACMDKSKVRMCSGPMDKAKFVYDIAAAPLPAATCPTVTRPRR